VGVGSATDVIFRRSEIILLDYSGVAIASIMVQVGFKDQIQLDQTMVRKMILNSIRYNYMRFKGEYGPELILACDDSSVKGWRKEVFPYYKVKRKKERQESPIDWSLLYEVLEIVKLEIKESFPYPVVEVPRAEADDVIAAICHANGTDFGGERILILSRDKDFIALQKYSNVRQFSPQDKKYIVTNDPEKSLKELIIRGDDGDSIPNILSVSDSFANGIRQKPMLEKRLAAFMQMDPQYYEEPIRERFRMNEQLIDLDNVPKDIQEAIILEYKSQQGKGRSKLFPYFMAHDLGDLIEAIGEF
jgi:5'-3' exonuclease